MTAASTALGSVLLLAASARGEPASAPSLLIVLTAFGAASAFGAGAYALSQQRLQWSRRVRNRLLMGLAVSGVALLIAVANNQRKRVGWTADVGVRPPVAAPVQKEKAPVGPEDVALFKPGWHGEFQQYGVYVIFTSFLENAAEARRFNRRLTRPVSYAMYSVINVALPSAVAVRTYQVSLVMDSGEEVRSLDVLPLLNQRRGLNEDLLRRLEKTQTLGTGSILPDVPVCMAPDFPWERVKCVRVKVGDLNVVVPGRMYSAEEKQALSEKPAAKTPTSSTNLSAEAWYKNL